MMSIVIHKSPKESQNWPSLDKRVRSQTALLILDWLAKEFQIQLHFFSLNDLVTRKNSNTWIHFEGMMMKN